ncbi:nicotinamide-nucleotide amidase [Methylobacillus rhizosphaerae]|uniref:Nicotinamide-nucleotide amidase n=1 Tax=Methylobacillus rhizosphaerae TaxID=551994 RepID=A0A239B4P7_9PROT|nr:nicotinamide-nucleotide amidase [Methylobacillus rhizosphaerae]SNS02512.1 nicotinamide-nucleotide amidase [Methylobacillus rhizosphaerae]
MADDAELLALSVQLGQALLERQWVLALAESCTGGWVAQSITAIPGSSAWFDRGFVTYSNLAKEQMLGVSASTLEHYGAVSTATAQEMAAGSLAHSAADISAAITGIAGPDGGSAQKPVGTICFGWAHKNGYIMTQQMVFSGDREAVRRQSVKTSLNGLLQLTLNTDL